MEQMHAVKIQINKMKESDIGYQISLERKLFCFAFQFTIDLKHPTLENSESIKALVGIGILEVNIFLKIWGFFPTMKSQKYMFFFS